MTGYLSRLFTLPALFLLGTALPAADLNIGDPAPPLEVSKWVKGDAVPSFKEGSVYVVEFWATWCGPCKTSIPHLTELQKKYQDVTFIGVSILEEDQAGVEPFVQEMGEKMDYRVALDQIPEGKDGSEGSMAKAWMDAAQEGGIPTAFVVAKDGKIAWIGHPISMDEPLQKIVSGQWDIALAAKERLEAKEMEAKLQATFSKFISLFRDDKLDEALAVVNEALTENPKLEETQLALIKFDIMSRLGKAEDAAAYGKKLISGAYDSNANALNFLAWSVVDPEKEGQPAPALLELALTSAKKAAEITEGEDPSILDTLAIALFKSGNAADALKTQEKVVKLFSEIVKDGEIDPGIKERLEQYKKAVEGGPTDTKDDPKPPAEEKKP